jgi:hypothetical protein
MSKNRILGVSEARIGLSLLMSLLVTLGYIVVRRLGDSPHPQPVAPSTAATFTDGSVRTALGVSPGQRAEHQTSYAPQWLEAQPEQSNGTTGAFTR